MPIGYSHITSRVRPRSRKAFVPLTALALCALVFAFGGEEAQAQQLSQEQQQHAVFSGQAAGEVTKTPFEAAPIEETSLQVVRQESTPLAGPAPLPVTGSISGLPTGLPTGLPAQPAPAPETVGSELPIEFTLPANADTVSGSALLPEPVSGSMTAPVEQDGPEAPVAQALTPLASELVTRPALPGDAAEPRPETASGLDPASTGDQETMPEPVVDPNRSPLAPEPELVAGEEKEFISLLVEEAPAAEPVVLGSVDEEGFYSSLSALETSALGAVETFENATADALSVLVDEAHSWFMAAEDDWMINTALTGLFSGEAESSPASEPVQKPESSSTESSSESPLKDTTPQPVSPFTPPVGSSFSLSGGQVGHGGVVLLLLCVLASGLILLRLDFKLLWAFCEVPKPSSALRLPLERPG